MPNINYSSDDALAHLLAFLLPEHHGSRRVTRRDDPSAIASGPAETASSSSAASAVALSSSSSSSALEADLSRILVQELGPQQGGHRKRVVHHAWHPWTAGLLATAGYDRQAS
ncbi:unnamed protein product [Protopolystoma xenopodis]|uniref:Uncharacterized protein n=1 Tax=Protopolystoma xenopodis TaxID=117903 RepID=A0A448XQG8_9PLAT|nr:unnamed protein product [Protopolystoma xenopodis]